MSRAERIARGLRAAADAVGLDDLAVFGKKAAQPLSEKAFNKRYLQHIDIRNRGRDADAVSARMSNEGFKSGMGVNLLPVWRGGAPKNIIEQKFLPQAGDTVYLVPQPFWVEGRNGARVAEGWRPEPHEILTVRDTGEDLYKTYLAKFFDQKKAFGGLAVKRKK